MGMQCMQRTANRKQEGRALNDATIIMLAHQPHASRSSCYQYVQNEQILAMESWQCQVMREGAVKKRGRIGKRHIGTHT